MKRYTHEQRPNPCPCAKCGRELPLTEEYYPVVGKPYVDGTTRLGKSCIDCLNARRRERKAEIKAGAPKQARGGYRHGTPRQDADAQTALTGIDLRCMEKLIIVDEPAGVVKQVTLIVDSEMPLTRWQRGALKLTESFRRRGYRVARIRKGA